MNRRRQKSQKYFIKVNKSKLITIKNRCGYFVVASMLLCLVFSCQNQRSCYIDTGSAAGLKKLLHYTGDNMYLLCAHRGGAEPDYPENCIATFENTLRHCYAMMEIDLGTVMP